VAAKEELAREFGATDFVAAGPDVKPQGSIAKAVKAVVPDGVDHSFECVGHPEVFKTALAVLDWGGQCVILGVPKLGTEASFVVADLYNDRSIMGCRYGSSRPRHDIPLIVDLYQSGRLKLDELVTKTVPLASISELVDDMTEGRLARGVLSV
jgi:S-(hydroxymethyl)glutathione dehydrogenase/alcohol dehydrogenase